MAGSLTAFGGSISSHSAMRNFVLHYSSIIAFSAGYLVHQCRQLSIGVTEAELFPWFAPANWSTVDESFTDRSEIKIGRFAKRRGNEKWRAIGKAVTLVML